MKKDPKQALGDSVWDAVVRAAETKSSGTLEVQTAAGASDVMIFVFPKNAFTDALEKSMHEQSECEESVETFIDPRAN